MKATVAMSLLAISLVCAPTAFTQDEAPKKTIKRIVEEIELVPSLYARGEDASRFKTLPKFSLVKLTGYPAPKKQTADTERESWTKDKAAYAKDFPLRALIFESADESAKVPEFIMSLSGKFEPKDKLVFLNKQGGIGLAIFKLEELLTNMRQADREKELSRRWRANGDFAQARVLGNLLFLYEYNFSLGTIRADALPQLGAQHDGWKLAPRPKLLVTESKVKDYARQREKLLKQIQIDYPDTPWMYFAEKEARRELGLAWEPRKK